MIFNKAAGRLFNILNPIYKELCEKKKYNTMILNGSLFNEVQNFRNGLVEHGTDENFYSPLY